MQFRIAAVRVVGEELGVDDPIAERASHREGITDDRPLRFAEQAQDFTQVVNQAGQDEPVLVPIGADGLGRLQQVLALGQGDVRVGVVH